MPIIVAINKVDLPQANPDRVKQELMQHGIVSEQWGGDAIFIEVSAKKGIRIKGTPRTDTLAVRGLGTQGE